jgi:hypothetical protein
VGNIDVGNKTAARNPDQPVIERLARTDGAPKLRIEAPNTVRMKRSPNCGAMSQQCGDSGNYSTPQKFVQLVGCRDPKAGSEKARSEKARSEPWVRPGPAKP